MERKFLRISSPIGPLFSGWNWQPRKLSFCSTALKKWPPYEVTAQVLCESVAAYECT